MHDIMREYLPGGRGEEEAVQAVQRACTGLEVAETQVAHLRSEVQLLQGKVERLSVIDVIDAETGEAEPECAPDDKRSEPAAKRKRGAEEAGAHIVKHFREQIAVKEEEVEDGHETATMFLQQAQPLQCESQASQTALLRAAKVHGEGLRRRLGMSTTQPTKTDSLRIPSANIGPKR